MVWHAKGHHVRSTTVISPIKNTLLAACVTISAASPTSVALAQNGEDETFRVSNESSFRIDHVFMSRSSNPRWGYDRLSGYLYPNYHLDLGVDPGRYDVKLIDKDGDPCVVKNVNIFDGTVFHVTDMVLLSCEWVSR